LLVVFWSFVLIDFHRVKEGEFFRLVETGTMTDFIAQESNLEPNKYHLFAINTQTGKGYTIRQARIDELRSWRLDRLALLLKKLGQKSFQVRNLELNHV
jgi:hypothetical protein